MNMIKHFFVTISVIITTKRVQTGQEIFNNYTETIPHLLSCEICQT